MGRGFSSARLVGDYTGSPYLVGVQGRLTMQLEAKDVHEWYRMFVKELLRTR